MIAYPTPEQVETADSIELLRWHRYLPSPGTSGIGSVDAQAFNQLTQAQCAILQRIKDAAGIAWRHHPGNQQGRRLGGRMIKTLARQPYADDKTYPSAAQVELADRKQLLDWCLNLPDPGESARREPDHALVIRSDLDILNLIFKRIQETRPPFLNWSFTGSQAPLGNPTGHVPKRELGNEQTNTPNPQEMTA